MQVKPYSIYDTSDKRLLVVDYHRAKRLVFFADNQKVKLKRVKGKLIAVVAGAVKVYKLPSEREFHKEYMQHTRIALWLGSAQLSDCYTGTVPIIANPDRLVSNMLEYEETI